MDYYEQKYQEKAADCRLLRRQLDAALEALAETQEQLKLARVMVDVYRKESSDEAE